MKRLFCLLLALILVLPTTACGVDAPSTPSVPSTTAPAPDKNIDQLIAKGDVALQDRSFDAAFKFFTEAGEAGEAKLENAKSLLKEELLDCFVDGKPEAVTKLMGDLVPTYIAEEEYHGWIVEYAQGKLDETAKYFQTAGNEFPDGSYDLEKSMDFLTELFSSTGIAENPENAAFMEQFNLNYALLKFFGGAKFHDERSLREGYELLKTCKEGSDGYAIVQALDGFKNHKYFDGMAVLEKHVLNKHVRRELMSCFKNEDRNYADDMNSMLEYYAVYYGLNDDSFNAKTLTENLDGSKLTLVYGIDKQTYDAKLSETRRDQLKEQIGSAPAGKILILHRRKVYGSKSTELDVVLSLMEYLPEEYFPTSLEEVEYVILMDSTYAKKGKFQNGTVRILETTKLTTYDVTTGKKLTSASKKGTLDTVMYYHGTAPKYYSCGSPKMEDSLIKAMEAISADMEK